MTSFLRSVMAEPGLELGVPTPEPHTLSPFLELSSYLKGPLQADEATYLPPPGLYLAVPLPRTPTCSVPTDPNPPGSSLAHPGSSRPPSECSLARSFALSLRQIPGKRLQCGEAPWGRPHTQQTCNCEVQRLLQRSLCLARSMMGSHHLVVGRGLVGPDLSFWPPAEDRRAGGSGWREGGQGEGWGEEAEGGAQVRPGGAWPTTGRRRTSSRETCRPADEGSLRLPLALKTFCRVLFCGSFHCCLSALPPEDETKQLTIRSCWALTNQNRQ